MRACVLLLTIACAEPARETITIEIETPSFDGVEGAPPVIAPARAVVRIERRGPRRYRAIVDRAAPLTVSAPGACPQPGGPFVRLAPSFTIEGERAQVGFGRPFALRAVPRCEGAEGAWSSSDPVEIDGLVVRGVMPPLESPQTIGVVAISPRTRATRRVTFTTGELTRTIEIHAATRATGVPSVPVRTRTYLRGPGLEIVARPRGSRAALERVDAATSAFIADARGRYELRASDGAAFSIFAGSHVATDLDCGRAVCHGGVAAHAGESPMTTVFARLLEDPGYTPGCAIGCHNAGELGVDDGGIAHVMTELDVALPRTGREGAYAALPRELRRLGGVGCTSCHGPGAIPEPGARERIVQSDVCAVCHDAPPRYGHVAAWRSSRMATARAGGTEAGCARCHTSGPGTREITCVACHSVHGEAQPTALLRAVAGSPIAGPSAVCVRCHDADPNMDLPLASAVPLVVGASTIVESRGIAAPHAALGCLVCHGTEPMPGIERGASHTFAVAEGACRGCHGRDMPPPRDLAARIAALAARVPETGHRLARPRAAEIDEVRWNVGLVAHDRGAWAHGGPTVITIVEALEAALE